jgi:Tol biopolymer transport system component
MTTSWKGSMILALTFLVFRPCLGRAASGAEGKPARAGSEPRTILREEGVKNAYPRWSRDASRILYQSNRSGKWQLFVMDRDGSHRTPLTDGSFNDNYPDWSPDNSSIAFVSDRDGNEEVYVMNADGSGLRNLSKSPAQDIHPYWSPDGTKILFNSTRDADRLQIYEATVATGEIRRLVDSPDDDTCARISPRGDRIVYLANLATGHDDIIVRKRDGSAPVNVTDDAPADGWPVWTPDGDRIVFSSRPAGAFALYVMAANGSQRRQITFPSPGDSDTRANVSRDGRQIVFNRDRGSTIGILSIGFP